jgi:hypothetical protein
LERKKHSFLHVVLKRGIKYGFNSLFSSEESKVILSFVAGLLAGWFWFRNKRSSVIHILLVLLISLVVGVSWLSVYAFLPLSWPFWLSNNPPGDIVVIPEVEALTFYFLWHPLAVKYYSFLIFPWHELLEFFAWMVIINVPMGLLGFLILTRKHITSGP